MGSFVVIGDIILDHNIYTTQTNPKLIDYNNEYNLVKEEYKLGGCGNVAANLRSLNASQVFLFSCIGDDENGRRLNQLINDHNIINCFKIVPGYNTTIKRRYYCDNKAIFQYANKINKELLLPVSFLKDIESILSSTKIDCIILCESERSSVGILSFEHCRTLISLAAKFNIPTIVDPKEDIDKYRGCTLIKPNRNEAVALLSCDGLLIDIHKHMMGRLQCKFSVITLSGDGISFYDGREIIAKYDGVVNVLDPIGAGDIVTSIIALLFQPLICLQLLVLRADWRLYLWKKRVLSLFQEKRFLHQES